jgi:DNA helicase II / ATP-dependent DNA helicase PcrA
VSGVAEELNEAQRRAVQTVDSPLLVIAGPGAGKTKTLVERLIHLVADLKVPAGSVLVSTFTEKAAKELVSKVSARAIELGIDVNLSEMYIGTLHSLFLRILKENRAKTGLNRNYRLLESFEQEYLAYREIRRFQALDCFECAVDPGLPGWEQAQQVVSLADKAMEEDLDEGRLLASSSPELVALGGIAKEYRAFLASENALDFSSIQSTLLGLLRGNPEVLAELRVRIRYLMVDEYQDTNAIQEAILLLIAAPSNRICVVGDDDQSLYRFRGATVRNILSFESRFPAGACARVELVTNYRSHPGIVAFYNGWMAKLDPRASWVGPEGRRYRHDKTIVPREGPFPDYPSVVRASGQETEEAWHEEVRRFLVALKERGRIQDYSQVAFLFRSVRSDKALGLAAYLESNGIPVFSPRSALFFEREEVRLVLGALVSLFPRLIEERLPWKPGAELPEWDYYRQCRDLFQAALDSGGSANLGLSRFCRERAAYHDSMATNAESGFTSLFYELLGFPLFSRYLGADLRKGPTELRAVHNLSFLSQILAKFEFLHNIAVIGPQTLNRDLRNLFNHYLRYLRSGGISEFEDFEGAAPSGCVSFMTIHQSKGLEFPVVVLDSLNSVPRRQDEAMDLALAKGYRTELPFEPVESVKYFDFWRLYYTAYSRAKDLLVLSGAERPGAKGLARLPSAPFAPFYDPLPDWREAGLITRLPPLPLRGRAKVKREYAFTTDILGYEDCPRQYQFFRELDFSPARTSAILFGTLVHQTIEDVHRAVLSGEAVQPDDPRIAAWLNDNYRSLSKSTRTYLVQDTLDAVEDHVRRYVRWACADWAAIREAEYRVAIVERDFILSGSIDLLRGEGESVEILDFKTERKPDAHDPLGRRRAENYKRQLEVYAHIVEERGGSPVSRLHLYYTGARDGSPLVSYDHDRARMERVMEGLAATVRKIEDKDFGADGVERSEAHCGGCDLRPYCQGLG